jgi:aspartate carbamoyltransferase catalytic subunit
MMLRLQSERMHGSFVPSTREYFHFFGLDYDKLRAAKADALIMHPGPMNRGVEIGSEIADDIRRLTELSPILADSPVRSVIKISQPT